MKRLIVLALLGALSVVGCNRDDTAAPSAQQATVSSPGTATPVPATTQADLDPRVVNAGLHLNEAKELMDSGKLDEAQAKLDEVEAVKDKLPPGHRATLERYSIVLKAGQNAFKSLNKGQ